jgi:hypothetical protein
MGVQILVLPQNDSNNNIYFDGHKYGVSYRGELYDWILTNLERINNKENNLRYENLYRLSDTTKLIELRDDIWNETIDNETTINSKLWEFTLDAFTFVKNGGIIYFAII